MVEQISSRTPQRWPKSEYTFLPDQIVEEIEEQMDWMVQEYGIAEYNEMLPKLDILCFAYIIQALRKLGFDYGSEENFTTYGLEQRLGVIARHHSLFQRMLQILQEDGILDQVGQSWNIRKTPAEIDTHALWETLVKQYPTLGAELISPDAALIRWRKFFKTRYHHWNYSSQVDLPQTPKNSTRILLCTLL